MFLQVRQTFQNNNCAFGSKAISKSAAYKEAVQRLAKANMSMPQIAKELGIPQSLVRFIIDKYNFNTAGQKALKTVSKEELELLIEQGYISGDISKMYGIDLLTVDKLFKQYNISSLDSRIYKAITAYTDAPSQENKSEALKQIDIYLMRNAQKEAETREHCSYNDYLQNLRLYFLEQLELCKNGQIDMTFLFKRIKQKEPTPDDMLLEGIEPRMYVATTDEPLDCKPLITLADVDEFSSVSETEKAIKDEYNTRVINILLQRLPEIKQKIANMRYGFYNEASVIRGDELSIDEIAKEMNKRNEAARAFLDKIRKELKNMINANPNVKSSLLESLDTL